MVCGLNNGQLVSGVETLERGGRRPTTSVCLMEELLTLPEENESVVQTCVCVCVGMCLRVEEAEKLKRPDELENT